MTNQASQITKWRARPRWIIFRSIYRKPWVPSIMQSTALKGRSPDPEVSLGSCHKLIKQTSQDCQRRRWRISIRIRRFNGVSQAGSPATPLQIKSLVSRTPMAPSWTKSKTDRSSKTLMTSPSSGRHSPNWTRRSWQRWTWRITTSRAHT